MEEIKNKRKIKEYKTIEKRYIHKKNAENIETQAEATNIEEKEKKEEKKNTISPFQLVVIKLPWYKKVFRSFMNFLGYYYD